MVNVKRYSINYAKFVQERLPEPLRFAEGIAFCMVLVLPVVFVYNLFIAWRTQILYNLTITPQVTLLQKLLNDRYDATLRRIVIHDGISYDPVWDFMRAEAHFDQCLFLKSESPAVYDFLKGEVSLHTFDFIVQVPAAVIFNTTEMRELVTQYKLAGKFFDIQTI